MSDPPYVPWGPGMTAATVQQQQEKDEWERNNNRRKYVPPKVEPMHYDPVIDESSGPMNMPPVRRSTVVPPVVGATKSTSLGPREVRSLALAGVALVVGVVVSQSSSTFGLIVTIVLLYLVFKSYLDNRPPVQSTGPEMDAALIAKYNKDLAKYQRKLQAARHEITIARAAGINNAAFNFRPKPPKRPILSSDRAQ